MYRSDYTPDYKIIEFQTTDWTGYDQPWEDSDESSDGSFDDTPSKYKRNIWKYMIKGYGTTEDGHSVAINVSGYKPYFFIKCPYKLTSDDETTSNDKTTSK